MKYDLEQLFQSGELNEYFYNQAKPNLQYLDDENKDVFLEEAMVMSELGINSPEDQKIYFYISSYVPDVIDDIVGHRVGKKAVEVMAEVFNNRDEYGISNLVSLFDAVAMAAHKVGLSIKPEVLNRLTKTYKIAYPAGYGGMRQLMPYNIDNWMRATRDIYSRANNGEEFTEALDAVTAQWSKMEKIDYKHWLRFYQEGAQNKYKLAQQGYHSPDGGYFPPMRYEFNNAPPMVHCQPDDMPRARNDVNSVRERVEGQRYKIISRLNAAEKLLSSLDGQLFAGDDQDFMLKLLQDLKRKVQTANKLRLKSSLFEDYIYRTGNYLNTLGKNKAANFFFKIAQGVEDDPAAELLGPTEDASVLGETPAASKEDTRNAFAEFFKLLETGVIDDGEDEDLEKAASDDALIVVEAQDPGVPQRQPEIPSDEKSGLSIDPETQADISEEKVDRAIDLALKDVTTGDVVHELELLSGLFKKREIARRLAVVDMMMDKIGISSFFPSLGEALRSALESNQYVSTRIEDVLSKLRGTIQEHEAEIVLDDKYQEGESAGLRANLEQQEKEEAERKERRKQQSIQKERQQQQEALAPAEAPGQEFAGPADVETAPPTPVR